MTDVEHYALSLIFCWLGGFQIGVASLAVEDSRAGKPKPYDLAYLFGFFIAIGYLFLGFKFVDGRYFIWIVALLVVASGHHVGRELASAREDGFIRGVILAASSAVPLLYHFALA